MPLLAVQCLDALLRLGRTCEGVAELLQGVAVPLDAEALATSTGVYASATSSSLQQCTHATWFSSCCMKFCRNVNPETQSSTVGTAAAGVSEAEQTVSERIPLLHQMLQALLQAARGREAEVLTHTLGFVGGLLPPALHPGYQPMGPPSL